MEYCHILQRNVFPEYWYPHRQQNLAGSHSLLGCATSGLKYMTSHTFSLRPKCMELPAPAASPHHHHKLQGANIIYYTISSHGSDSRQGLMQPPLSSVSSPEQAPGTEHVLFLVCRPSPHVVLQDCWDQVDHSTLLMKTKFPWPASTRPLASASSL